MSAVRPLAASSSAASCRVGRPRVRPAVRGGVGVAQEAEDGLHRRDGHEEIRQGQRRARCDGKLPVKPILRPLPTPPAAAASVAAAAAAADAAAEPPWRHGPPRLQPARRACSSSAPGGEDTAPSGAARRRRQRARWRGPASAAWPEDALLRLSTCTSSDPERRRTRPSGAAADDAAVAAAAAVDAAVAAAIASAVCVGAPGRSTLRVATAGRRRAARPRCGRFGGGKATARRPWTVRPLLEQANFATTAQ